MGQPSLDATLQSLENLKDPSRFTKIPGVPIFRAHSRKRINPITKQEEEIVVTNEDLNLIVHNMRVAEDVFGVAGRYTDGHIIPHGHDPNDPGALVPESKQPKVLALYTNPRVEPFGPKKIPAVMVDLNVYNEDLETVKKHRPQRSAEYYHNRKVIKGVAALVRDPELDMGVIAYGSGDLLYYSMDNWLPDGQSNYSSIDKISNHSITAHRSTTAATSGANDAHSVSAEHLSHRAMMAEHPMAKAAFHQAAAQMHGQAASSLAAHSDQRLAHRMAEQHHVAAAKHHAGDGLHLLNLQSTPDLTLGNSPMANEQLTPDEVQTFNRLCQKANQGGKLHQYIGSAMASPTNTVIPHSSTDVPVLPPGGHLGVTPSRPASPPIPGLTPSTLADNLPPSLYEFNAMKTALAQQQQQLEVERNARLRTQAEQIVDHLVNVDHKRLNRDKEISLFMACPDDAARLEKAQYIREYYDEVPNPADRIRTYEGPVEGGAATFLSGGDVDAAIAYMGSMASKGEDCTWDQALEAIKKKK